jgi:hypothetical protein
MKSYGAVDVDERDRLGHEFDGLRFLRTADVGIAVPAALAVDRDAQCALYEWIEGVVPTDHGSAEIGAALDVLGALHRARHAPSAADLPIATEAVLRLGDLEQQIESRLARLSAVAPSEPALAEFLQTELRPELRRRLDRLAGWELGTALPPAQRTLSPSDFGLHNALRRTDGTLSFIDFEYFGWDDPAKLTADFLLHPAMQLSTAQRRQFIDGAVDLYGSDPTFLPRLSVCFPLYGLRWSLIILNEFLPERWARRAFAGKGGDWSTAKCEQLRKAGAKLVALRSYEEGQLA